MGDQAEAGYALQAREQVKELLQAAVCGSVAHLQETASRTGLTEIASVKDGNGRTALHIAAQAGNTAVCRHLLEAEGLDPNMQDEAGETPLATAAGAGQLEATELLLSRKASVHRAAPAQAGPLHRAAGAGAAGVVAALLKHGADANEPAAVGPPLLWAAGSGHVASMEALLAAGARADAANADGVTPILAAAAAGRKDAVVLLSRTGADVTRAAMGGVTPLHAAAESGSADTVRALLMAGANADAEDSAGSKPIHAAMGAGSHEAVATLLPYTRNVTAASLDNHMRSMGVEMLPPELSARAAAMPAAQKVSAEQADKAAELKRSGDGAFQQQQYGRAVDAYSQALEQAASNHLLWANRSAAYLKEGRAQEALDDARRSRRLQPKYMKAWYREACAAEALQQWEPAAQAYFEAFSLEPHNSMLAKSFQNAVAEGKKEYAAKRAASAG